MRHFILTLLCFPLALFSQTASWTGTTFEHEVTELWGYAFSAEYRAEVGEYRFGEYQFSASADRKFTDAIHITLMAGYDATFRTEPSVGSVTLDTYYERGLGDGPFTLEGRLRLEHNRNLSEEPGIANTIRPRLGLKWEISDRLEAIAELEFRFRYDERKEWVRNRRTAGLVYDLSDRVNVEIFYRLQRDINAAEADTQLHIIGTYVSYVLPDSRDRDWKYRRPFGRRVF